MAVLLPYFTIDADVVFETEEFPQCVADLRAALAEMDVNDATS